MLEPPETSGGRALGPLTAALFAGLVAAVPAHALTAVDCANLTNATVPNPTITRASLVPARGGVPEYRKVRAHVEREINLELRLPTVRNDKLYHPGGSGLVGWLPGPAAGALLG